MGSDLFFFLCSICVITLILYYVNTKLRFFVNSNYELSVTDDSLLSAFTFLQKSAILKAIEMVPQKQEEQRCLQSKILP